MIVNSNVVNPPGNFQLSLCGLCHAVLIDRQNDHRRVVFPGKGEDLIGFFTTRFKMSGVDQTTSRCSLQSDFKHIHFGGVDHERNIHTHLQLLHNLAHQLGFVRALGDGDGNIQRVCTARHLFTSNVEDAIVIFFEQQTLELARTLRVTTFTKQGRGGVLSHGDG